MTKEDGKKANSPALVWVKNDIRLNHNPALYEASCLDKEIIILYIDDNKSSAKSYYSGGAMRLWTHYSLKDFLKNIREIGGNLIICQGNPLDIIQEIIKETNADTVFWNRSYLPQEIKRESEIKDSLKKQDIHVESFKANYLFEPHTVKNKENAPYKVYTPFRKALEAIGFNNKPLPKPKKLVAYQNNNLVSSKIEDIFPLSTNPDWGSDVIKDWNVSENGAYETLEDFLKHGLNHYKGGRDFPSKNYVSKLSPYLARGMITPLQIIDALKNHQNTEHKAHFISELLWREFATYLLFHFPYMEETNFRKEWDKFPWKTGASTELTKWKKGQTGFPIIDAGMRELRQTGYMHNRVRMIVASFLVKHLLIDWHEGEAWFRDNLFDFDVANNIASWQWVAGSGADAAPYFRIFNPILQSKKFDPDGEYILKYVGELKNCSDIHEPLFSKNYPSPMIDLKIGRDKALEKLKEFSR